MEKSQLLHENARAFTMAHKYMVERSQVIVESLTGVKKVDLGIRPDPRTLLIGLITPYGRA